MYYLLSEVYVVRDGNHIVSLGTGTTDVIDFYNLAKKGIDGAVKTEFSFSCNVDVTITGEKLLEFIKKEYPDVYEKALKNIENNESMYTIICYDLS